MRVTSNTFPNTLIDQLGRLTLRQYRLQEQASTGQRLSLPEDDPTAMQRVLNLQVEARGIGQYRENVIRLRDTAQASFELIRGVKRVSDRAGEIAVLADGTESADELRLYAIEVTALIKEAVQIANTTFQGEYLLGGTRTQEPPFVLTTDASGRVTGVTYQGNTSVAETEIAEGVTVSAHSLGANDSGSGPRGVMVDNRYGADLFGHLIELQNHLIDGDVNAIASNDRSQLAQDEENLLAQLGQNGALQARLESSEKLGRGRAEALEVLVSQEADADLAQTLVRLNQTQNAYQAALQSGARILNQSLLDYLR